MSLLFSVLLLYNRRGDSYNKVKRKSTGAELMTIKEIAKLAQVSSAAVSRYMNGGYVSEEKKERIRAVIEVNRIPPVCTGENASHQTSVPGRSDCSKDQFRVDQ